MLPWALRNIRSGWVPSSSDILIISNNECDGGAGEADVDCDYNSGTEDDLSLVTKDSLGMDDEADIGGDFTASGHVQGKHIAEQDPLLKSLADPKLSMSQMRNYGSSGGIALGGTRYEAIPNQVMTVSTDRIKSPSYKSYDQTYPRPYVKYFTRIRVRRSIRRRIFLVLTEPQTSITSAAFFAILISMIFLSNILMMMQTMKRWQFSPQDCIMCGG